MNENTTHLLVAMFLSTTFGSYTVIHDQSNDPLFGIEIRQDDDLKPYNRALYHYTQRTRSALLTQKSLIPVTYTNPSQRTVKSGRWFDVYTGVIFRNARDVDIDHLVPLYEVHISGGHDWDQEKKQAFANDLSVNGPLRVTHRWTNRIPKNADDPSKYSPSYVPARCQYLKDWISIKRKWGLTADPDEAKAIRSQYKACG